MFRLKLGYILFGSFRKDLQALQTKDISMKEALMSVKLLSCIVLLSFFFHGNNSKSIRSLQISSIPNNCLANLLLPILVLSFMRATSVEV